MRLVSSSKMKEFAVDYRTCFGVPCLFVTKAKTKKEAGGKFQKHYPYYRLERITLLK